MDDSLSNIVAERFDAGIRLAHAVDKDIVGVPVGPAFRVIAVASPAYLAQRGTATSPHDVLAHRCLRYRLTSSGQLSPWRLSHNGRSLPLKVDGPQVCNDNDTRVQAALGGLGLARVLPSWSSALPRRVLHHPSRRQVPPARVALITALWAPGARWRDNLP